jgi:hypothetical protein
MKTYSGLITKLNPNQIFVFGSNTEGIHGAGAAKQAIQFGAIYGQAEGRQGQTYAIITKDLSVGMRSIPKFKITRSIDKLYAYAMDNHDLEFLIAYSGAGKNLNGYTNREMAGMFWSAGLSQVDKAYLDSETTQSVLPYIPKNIVFEREFWQLIQDTDRDMMI